MHFEKIKKFEKGNQKKFFLDTTLEERIKILENLLRSPLKLKEKNEK